uniref:Uncharacterized protein n=1 Tax=Arundo donax TaxID=35708 RepID=A0A0A8ZP85_ARUDO
MMSYSSFFPSLFNIPPYNNRIPRQKQTGQHVRSLLSFGPQIKVTLVANPNPTNK